MKMQVRGSGMPEFRRDAPLYERVPSKDDEGRLLGDFMMLIPGLRDSDANRFRDRVAGIQAVLNQYSEVVFADLNVPLNILWVSIKPKTGVISSITSDLQGRIPEALLIASDQS